MLGAVIGDVIGSRFEFKPIKTKDFELFEANDNFNKSGQLTVKYFVKGSRFTDDTVMTVAICKSLLDCNGDYTSLGQSVITNMKLYGKKYPLAGYGARFNHWLMSTNSAPYNSFGNGSAMRIGAVPYFAKSLDDVKELTKAVTVVTHNHPEGIKGAEAIAVCIWLALQGATKDDIKQYVENHYYELNFDYADLIKNYDFDETCQGSVPQAIYCFLISDSFEDTIRTAVSIGGDADTIAAMAGAIAEAYYGIPTQIKLKVLDFLPYEFIDVINAFNKRIIVAENN